MAARSDPGDDAASPPPAPAGPGHRPYSPRSCPAVPPARRPDSPLPTAAATPGESPIDRVRIPAARSAADVVPSPLATGGRPRIAGSPRRARSMISFGANTVSDPPSDPGRLLAGPHNARLGPAIHAFNLPAEPGICIGASPACEATCYAKAFLFQLQHGRHRRNYERSLEASFPGAMIAEIRRGMVRVVRVHTSGDFYDGGYVSKWAEVARASPGTAFFAYTRGWRREDVLAELIGLARLPNVSLWFSEDRDTGRPPAAPRIRRAYLLSAGQAEDDVPA